MQSSGSWYLRRLAFTRSWWGRGENQSLLFSIGRSLSPLLFEKLSNRLPEGWLLWCRVVVTFAFIGSCCWDRFQRHRDPLTGRLLTATQRLRNRSGAKRERACSRPREARRR